jgi:hypothetical protein
MQIRQNQPANDGDDMLHSGQPAMQLRYQIIGLADSDLHELQTFWPMLDAALPEVLDAFVAHTLSVPTSAR